MIFLFTSFILIFALLWWSGTKPPLSPRSACIQRDPEKFRLRSPQLEMCSLHKGPQHSDSCGECPVSGLRDTEDAFSQKFKIQTTPQLGHSVLEQMASSCFCSFITKGAHGAEFVYIWVLFLKSAAHSWDAEFHSFHLWILTEQQSPAVFWE